ncbi:patatin-like phospholipase family protein [Sphingomonas sp. ZB1N12]|uniref:hypothetical protein n=1 Tax=Sphingomonas arabinosi TaxID=3096160 RepID=UPI002FCA07F8
MTLRPDSDTSAAPEPEPKLPDGEAFAGAAMDCDVVMKGGITSGVVYPYAIIELARRYRFRSIGGTSAGAIAAAFAAAAEYSRSVREDPAGFVRLQQRCEELPERLVHLFQPRPRFAPLMAHFLRSQRWGRSSIIWALPLVFPFGSLFGAALGALAMWSFDGATSGIVLGAFAGLLLFLVVRATRLVLVDFPRSGFGLCTGLSEPHGNGPAITDWMHEALQFIAFGQDPRRKPLTFGDLAGADPANPIVNLRMITTNLSMQRPHTLPRLGLEAGIDIEEWRELFPRDVIDHIVSTSEAAKHFDDLLSVPNPADLPVVVAARMSLSFPVLFTAIPLHVLDFATATLARATGAERVPQRTRILVADGGISSNFPIHLFDALLPERPTFALSLDRLPNGPLGEERVFIPDAAGQGVGLPINPIGGVADYAASVLASAKDWQDQLLSTMPGQRERIAHVLLSKDEGGLNLTMPPIRSRALMERGREVGRRFADGALDFDEHRWRRALVVYDQLEDAVIATGMTWSGGFGEWLRAYMDHPGSYEMPKGDRARIHERLQAFASLMPQFEPIVGGKRRKLPNPRGRLRIDPDY